MPEINNKEIKKENTPAIKGIDPSQMNPKTRPEAQFVLPTRRGYSKYIIIPIVLIVFFVVGWFVYGYYNNQVTAPTTEPEPIPEVAPIEVKSDKRYYLAYDSVNFAEARIYQYSKDGDIKLGTINQKNLFIAGKFTRPYSYLVNSNDGKLQILDATTAKLEPLFDLEDPKIQVRNVAVSIDNKWMAYARNFEGNEKDPWAAELWLYNIETKEQKMLVKKTALTIYQGFSVLGWRNDNKEIVVSALGGDAGAVWGDIYVANVETGKLDKINPVEEDNKVGFITGKLSPNGNKWLFQYCAEIDKVAQAKDGENFLGVPCASGTELQTYDFGTKSVKTVYQNLRYDNNADKSILRTFMSLIWEDDNTIIAAAPGAILSIPVGSPDKTSEVLTYDRYNPQNYKNNFIGLVEANSKQIIYTSAETWNVFDRASQKNIDLNPEGRKENINFWLD